MIEDQVMISHVTADDLLDVGAYKSFLRNSGKDADSWLSG